MGGEKRPGIDPEILFYKVEGYDKSDNGDISVIHVKIEKYGAATTKNLKRLTFPVIK